MWASIRNGTWVTGSRLTGYPLLFLALYTLAGIGWVISAHSGIDPHGTPLGADFIIFWGASATILQHGAAAAYNEAALAVAQTTAFGRPIEDYAFFYPPFTELLVLPLALLPYGVALMVWIVAQAALTVAIFKQTLNHRLTTRLLLAFPATFITIFGGQNALLSAALLAGGLLLLERQRQFLAGAVFALLLYKPHLGAMVPVALVAGRQWRSLAGGMVMAAALGLLTLLAFGPEAWAAFLAHSQRAGQILTEGLVNWGKMASVYAGARQLGTSSGVAWGLQGVMIVAVTLVVARVWSRPSPFAAKAATLVTATVLATPYLFDYDLAILAVPLVWIVKDRLQSGFQPYEKTALVACWMFPLAVRPLGMALSLPIGPVFLIGLLTMAARGPLNPRSP